MCWHLVESDGNTTMFNCDLKQEKVNSRSIIPTQSDPYLLSVSWIL